jgi:hypothetical protein
MFTPGQRPPSFAAPPFRSTNRQSNNIQKVWRDALQVAAKHQARGGRKPLTFTRDGVLKDVRSMRMPHNAPAKVRRTATASACAPTACRCTCHASRLADPPPTHLVLCCGSQVVEQTVADLLMWARSLAAHRISIRNIQFLVDRQGRMWLFDITELKQHRNKLANTSTPILTTQERECVEPLLEARATRPMASLLPTERTCPLRPTRATAAAPFVVHWKLGWPFARRCVGGSPHSTMLCYAMRCCAMLCRRLSTCRSCTSSGCAAAGHGTRTTASCSRARCLHATDT